jgi:hypothetical protein
MQRAPASPKAEIRNSKLEIVMILALRRSHRRIFTVLSVFLPLMFALGIAARRTVPYQATLPPELSSWTQTFTATDERGDLFDESPVRIRLWREQERGLSAVGFTASHDFLKPDLMAYWSVGYPTTGGRLPPDARLLGAFAAGPLVLPPEASRVDGHLILFSLANQEIVDVSKPVRFSDSIK